MSSLFSTLEHVRRLSAALNELKSVEGSFLIVHQRRFTFPLDLHIHFFYCQLFSIAGGLSINHVRLSRWRHLFLRRDRDEISERDQPNPI
jgi:hypothetical protein